MPDRAFREQKAGTDDAGRRVFVDQRMESRLDRLMKHTLTPLLRRASRPSMWIFRAGQLAVVSSSGRMKLDSRIIKGIMVDHAEVVG
jgi:hypothetical protein